jgi:hypothetical protein
MKTTLEGVPSVWFQEGSRLNNSRLHCLFLSAQTETKPGVVAHINNPSTQETGTGDQKVSLGYMEDPVSKTK